MRSRNVSINIFSLLVIFIMSLPVIARANTGMTYHGRIMLPNGRPLEASNVNFDIQIRSPGGENCLLYEESQNLNMTNSSGIFVLTIGSGFRANASVDGGNSFNKIFANRGSLTGLPTCIAGSTYSPNTIDGRKLLVQFNDGSAAGWQTLPPQDVNFNPFAIEAMQIAGYGQDQLLRVADGVTATEFSASDWTALWNLITGSSTVYSKADGSNFAPSANVNFNGKQIINLALPTSASMAATKGYVDSNFLSLGGGTLSGNVNVGANTLTNVGHIQIAAQGTLFLGKFTNAQENALKVGPPALAASDTGRTLYNTDLGRMRYWDGSNFQNVAAESYVATEIGIATASMVTAVNGTAGEISSTGGTAPTLSLATTGVAAASYGSSVTVPQLTVDSKGRITGASNVAISVSGALGYTPVNRAGDTMQGFLVLNADPSVASGAATKQYVDAVSTAASGTYIRKDGTTALTGDWDLDGASLGTIHLTGLAAPTAADGAATKGYVDAAIVASSYSLPNTSVVAGSYGTATQVSKFTVDAQGRLTSASNVNIALPLSQLTAGAASTGDYIKFNGANWISASFGSAVTAAEADPNVPSYFKSAPSARINVAGGFVDLANSGVSAGSYGSSSQIPTFVVDQYGRLTSASYAVVNDASKLPLAGGTMSGNINMASFAISNLAAPSAAQDAATKAYVDGAVGSAGTITSVNGVAGETTVSGTSFAPAIGLASTGVAAATYGAVDKTLILTVDSKGRLTSASQASIAIAPSQLTSGGAGNNDVLKWNGSNWVSGSVVSSESDPTVATYAKSATGLSGRITTTANQLDLASSGVVVGTYGSTTTIPVLTVDTYGRVTVASSTSLAGAVNAIETDPTVPSYFKTAPQNRLANNSGKLDLSSSGVSAATYGSSTQIPVLTIDTYGRITSATYSSLNAYGDGSTILASFGSASAPGLAFLGDSDTGIFEASANYLGFATGGTQRMVVDSSGNVGVGVAAPTAKLDVNGQVKGTTLYSSGSLYIQNTADIRMWSGTPYASAGAGWSPAGTAITTTNDIIGTGGNFSGLAFNTRNQAATYQIAWIGAAANTSGVTPELVFGSETAANSYNERMRISATGNVGIGSTTPNSLLTVEGVTALRETSAPGLTANYGKIYVKSSDSKLYFMNSSGVESQLGTGGTYAAGSTIAASFGSAASPGLTFIGDSDTGFFENGANTIGVAAGGTNLWNISSTGIASPTTGGALIANSIGSASYPTFSFVGDTDTGWYRASADTLAAATAGQERIRIAADGKVGIGVTDADSQLKVSNATSDFSGGDAGFRVNHNNATLDPAQQYYGEIVEVTMDPTADTSASNLSSGAWILNHVQNTNTRNFNASVRGITASTELEGSGTVTDAIGLKGYVRNWSNTVTDATGIAATVIQNSASAPITNAYGLQILNFPNSGTITNGYGIKIGTVAGTNTYGMYQASAANQNYFAGKIGVGVISPSAMLQLQAGSATASTAPLKFTAGPNLSTPEAGAVEYDGTNLYITDNTNTRRTLATTSAVAASYYSAGSTLAASYGSAAAPGLTFNGNTDTGFFNSNPNTANDSIGIAIGGTNIWNITSSSFASTTAGGALISNSNVGTASYPTFSFVGDAGTGWFRAAASTLAASTGGAERIRIDSSGKVGIGTALPNAKLDVNGDALIHGLTVGLGKGSASYSTAVGINALNSNITGDSNIAIGTQALLSNTTGSGNVALGNNTLVWAQTVNGNTALGFAADQLGTGAQNTAVGNASMAAGGGSNTGWNNAAVGYYTLYNITSGSSNAVLGPLAGTDITTGNNNIVIGAYTSGTGVTTGSNNILIGQDVRAPANTASNQLNIGNLVYATGLSSGATASTGHVGIGTSAPGSGTALSVEGQIRSKSASTTGASIDFANGNTIITSFDCSSNLTLANIRDGGSYSVVVTSAGTSQCNFDTATTGDDAATVTYRFYPPNGTRTSGSHTVYSLLRAGNTVYVSWITGF